MFKRLIYGCISTLIVLVLLVNCFGVFIPADQPEELKIKSAPILRNIRAVVGWLLSVRLPLDG